jgi:exopolysaccharide biosynthesis protein
MRRFAAGRRFTCKYSLTPGVKAHPTHKTSLRFHNYLAGYWFFVAMKSLHRAAFSYHNQKIESNMRQKFFFIILIGMLSYAPVLAQSYTLATKQVITQGFVYKKYTTTTPWVIHVLEVDVSDPTVHLQTAKSNNVLGGALQTVKQIAAGKDNNGSYHNVVGAINGDFFSGSDHNPANMQVSDGQILKYNNGIRSVFGFTEDKLAFVTPLAQQYQLTLSGGATHTINKVNGSRETDMLVLYNQYTGGSTGTNSSGTELKLALAPGEVWAANKPVKCAVIAKQSGVGNMSFSAGQAVLSGHGVESSFLNNNMSIGDTVTLTLNIVNTIENVKQVMGGFPKIVVNGKNCASQSVLDEGGTSGQATSREPRTAVGVSEDGRTVFFVVVDGRTTASDGMSMIELGNLLIYLGAYNGINLDGGGSSTLVANNVVKNVPSDGSERSVANALLGWSSSLLMDDFEAGEGHFTTSPTYDGQYTVGISNTSTLDRVTSTAVSGTASERAILNDDPNTSASWRVRLLSGFGLPANNYRVSSSGTVGVWLKTSTAQSGATVHLWFDDSDGAEETPGIPIINDGQWHQYNFDLNYSSGTAITGDGNLDGATVTLDALVLKQPNTSSPWTVYFDEIAHNKSGSGTGVTSQSSVLDDFESGEGHFARAPTDAAGGTQYTQGILSSSTLNRITSQSYRGAACEEAVLLDDPASSSAWTVRLLSGSGMPSNNKKITSEGTLSFWLKTSTAAAGATVQVWFDDSDGAEESPALTIINDGQWHKYAFDLSNYNGQTITSGNGELDATLVTLDAIVIRQPNTSSTLTLEFDDVMQDVNDAGTEVKKFPKGFDDFEINEGHFDKAPTYTSGTQYTQGISVLSTLDRVVTDPHWGSGSSKAVLYDSAGSSTSWRVRLLSGSGIPSNNIRFESTGTFSFWLKTSTAASGATAHLWFDDGDGAEESPGLSIINDGEWHKYSFDLDNLNGQTITTGNGELDSDIITLDAIVLKQPNTSNTWTVYIDDLVHDALDNSGTTTSIAPIGNRLYPLSLVPVEKQHRVIQMYPNPNRGSIVIGVNDEAAGTQLEIFNAAGERVYSRQLNAATQRIDVSHLPSGMYFIHLTNKGQKTIEKMVIKK